MNIDFKAKKIWIRALFLHFPTYGTLRRWPPKIRLPLVLSRLNHNHLLSPCHVSVFSTGSITIKCWNLCSPKYVFQCSTLPVFSFFPFKYTVLGIQHLTHQILSYKNSPAQLYPSVLLKALPSEGLNTRWVLTHIG